MTTIEQAKCINEERPSKFDEFNLILEIVSFFLSMYYNVNVYTQNVS